MARSNTGSASNYFSSAGSPIVGAPVSMSCWFTANSLTAGNVLISIDTNGATDHFMMLSAQGDLSGDPVIADAYDFSNESFAQTSLAYSTTSRWQHAAAVFASNSSRTVYLNGSNSGTDTVTVNAVVSYLRLGCLRTNSGGITNVLNGAMAEAAIWAAALTDDEIRMLASARGRDMALKVRRNALVGYWPLDGHSLLEPDLIGGRHMTMTGAMAPTNHPFQSFARKRLVTFGPAIIAAPSPQLMGQAML